MSLSLILCVNEFTTIHLRNCKVDRAAKDYIRITDEHYARVKIRWEDVDSLEFEPANGIYDNILVVTMK